MHSKLEFQGINYQKALAYLRIVAGEQVMRLAGLGRLIPKWKGKKVDSLKVTGQTGRDIENWSFSPISPSIFEERMILALVVEVGILISMGSHSYEFGGKFFLQLLGGPIGLSLTVWLASLVMKCFDVLWLSLMKKSRVKILKYLRYVDDSRNFLNQIPKGWRWSKESNKFIFNLEWEAQDIASNLPDDKRNVNLLLEAKNGIMPFLRFTGECPSDFSDCRLPTLDCNIFVSGKSYLFSFYEKPMRTEKSLDAATALPKNTIISSLRQEIIRRLVNMHPLIDISEKIEILDRFYDKLSVSGHQHDVIRLIFVEALLKFNFMLENSKKDPSDPNFKPIHVSNEFNKVERGIKKFLLKFNWYIPTPGHFDQSWKAEVPNSAKLATLRPRGGRFGSKSQKNTPSTVLFVPNSNQGVLLSNLEKVEPMLARLSGYSVKLVEAGGIALSRLFSVDLSSGRCHRADCAVCDFHTGTSSSKCKRKSVVYESRCLLCYDPKSSSKTGVYVGETGRTLYERAAEHLEDAYDQKKGSHIFKHWAIAHPEETTQPPFKFSVLRQHRSPLDRQLHEAIRISTHDGLNSRAEYRQNQIQRLSVQFTDRELKAVERELAKDDHETEAALKSLSLRLKNKVVSNNFVLNCSADQGSQEHSLESLKRSLNQESFPPAKRIKVFQDNTMGRKSKGNSANESRNLYKRDKDWPEDSWWSQEILRSQKGSWGSKSQGRSREI